MIYDNFDFASQRPMNFYFSAQKAWKKLAPTLPNLDCHFTQIFKTIPATFRSVDVNKYFYGEIKRVLQCHRRSSDDFFSRW